MRHTCWILLLIGFVVGEPLQAGGRHNGRDSLSGCPKSGQPERLSLQGDTVSIYQGLQLKLDLGNLVYELGMSHGKTQSYEIVCNVRLKGRFYPTIEAGVVPTAHTSGEGGTYDGHGGFARLGMDLNPFRNTAGRSAFIIGVRYANAWQKYHYDYLAVAGQYWPTIQLPQTQYRRFDAWFEVLLGVQVQVHKAFYMGLDVRLKVLGSRTNKYGNGIVPAYIPGFGERSDTNYGFHYYVAIGL